MKDEELPASGKRSAKYTVRDPQRPKDRNSTRGRTKGDAPRTRDGTEPQAPRLASPASLSSDPRRQSVSKRYPSSSLASDPVSLLSKLREVNLGPNAFSKDQLDPVRTLVGHNNAIFNISQGIYNPKTAFATGFIDGWLPLRRKGTERSIPLKNRSRLAEQATIELGKSNSVVTWEQVKDLLLHVAGEDGLVIVSQWVDVEMMRGRVGATRIVEVFDAIMNNQHLEPTFRKTKGQGLTPLSATSSSSTTAQIPTKVFLAYIASRSILHDPKTPFSTVISSFLHSRFPPIRKITLPSAFIAGLARSADYTPTATKKAQSWVAQVALAQLWSREEGSGLGVIRVAISALRKGDSLATWSIWEAIRRGSKKGSEVQWISNGWTEHTGYLVKEASTLEIDLNDLNFASTSTQSASSLPLDVATSAFIPLPPAADYVAPNAVLTEAILAPLLAGFTRAGLFTEAGAIWTWLADHNPPLVPTVVSWTALLQGYSTSNGAESAVTSVEETWEAMLASGVEPDVKAWTRRIDVYFNNKRPDQAMKLVEVMRVDKRLLVTVQGHFPQEFYGRVVAGLLRNGKTEAAQDVLANMEKNGLTPSINTLNSLLHHYAFGTPDFPAIVKTLRQISSSPDIQPDVFTFTIILQALLRTNQREASQKLIKIMEMTKVKPSVTTYGMIIGQLCSEGKEMDLIAAVELLDEMERSGLGSNEIVYTSIIQGFLKGMKTIPFRAGASRPSPIFNLAQMEASGLHPFFAAAMAIKKRMEARGLVLNRIGSNAIISSALALQTNAGVELAITTFDDLRAKNQRRRSPAAKSGALDAGIGESEESGQLAVADTWYVMLNGFVEMGDWARARVIVGEMQREKFRVTSNNLKHLVSLVIRGGSVN